MPALVDPAAGALVACRQGRLRALVSAAGFSRLLRLEACRELRSGFNVGVGAAGAAPYVHCVCV